MTVEKTILDSIHLFSEGRTESAFGLLAHAVDATATREAGRACSHPDCYKAFLQRNMVLITTVSFGGPSVANMNLQFNNPKWRTTVPGMVTLPEVLYHMVRSCLVHEANLHDCLEFADSSIFSCDDGNRITIPRSLFLGIVIAVAASPVNEGCRTESNLVVNLREDLGLHLDSLWGKRDELCSALSQALGTAHLVTS